ncbi:MAG: 30S ribosomal protein S3 [SAR86 cluster bacterium BACL1 MAG-121105-bin34]|jgi:small subunit ribosomal protein S3|uniref:Small ribosomal subunit protein uS3 n=2 Tax=SAR86 cluster TaxID=62672 RepID=A0A0R2U9H0_9GAMM|nr:MAG: 30S ribosomal protein S3 [SAR86 cluster bacterium BACL1 MAG-120507-bin14]KRO96193.1 MAG: 30S ribosomal protein S3 [SAR86 cluster bacterium BACL1 MAG-120820-bin45]KRO97501.1 MAG: 30S ribosomal protein S3 [SAR86 cluster bacterium BACL1 MAG-120828-bin5]KRO98889.1 MAG: 30S ribosomal protein S3 [SAR86 cluster bacterium BACL1 MAG-120823-bin87]KRP00389.1 MAG: 30S ribosomal protein S3 [SAR86 cluster bacterium BACL1 MAG-120813-bin36]KRP02153.1 MAG: 30S ribosomal protein S3 [SAR86 cluster bacter
MGQKVHPIGFRLGVIKKHNALWYAKGKAFKINLIEDLKVRNYIKDRLKFSSISRVDLERSAQTFTVNIHTSRPGIIIGKKGEEIESLKSAIQKLVTQTVQINIKEVRKPDLDATILAEGIAQQLERRVQFRRAMKRAVQSAMRQGAKGIRTEVSGRLGGAEIARSEWYREGQVPLHTLRANIDYGVAEALTTYGLIGVKVHVYTGEILGDPFKDEDQGS